uniref:Uncharacterized protein n=1 Tax=Arundo donax TaxID=35708 RepID=A0A0A8YA87_ARUDO
MAQGCQILCMLMHITASYLHVTSRY